MLDKANTVLARASIKVTANDPEDIAGIEAWLRQWRPVLTYLSEDRGAEGIHHYDVEGPVEAVEAIPGKLRVPSQWTKNGVKTGVARSNNWRDSAPQMGCAVGGCLVPLLLYLLCLIFLHDAGGPLIWPFVAVPCAMLGYAIGSAIKGPKD